uniref:26S protease regulatory subunit 6A-like protein n=1 Tax=Triticum urartu TaxID=4572 RepID=A0A8R7U168_TRIUA
MSSSPTPAPDAGAAAMAVDDSSETDQLDSMSTEDIVRATRLLDNEVRVLKDELQRNNLELENVKDKIKENQEKIKLNKQLPYLVGNIVEVRASPAPGIYPIWMWMRKLWVSVPSS